MAKDTSKILQQMVQDFKIISNHFEMFFIKRLRKNASKRRQVSNRELKAAVSSMVSGF